jgi:putative ABC transport system ATP-binding protein
VALTHILRAEGLSKTYGAGEVSVTALKDADLRVGEGEFLAIMGPSGSGKSTLLHLLGGLEPPSGGEIFIRGQEITGLSDKRLTLVRRTEIGFVFQAFNLLPMLTAAENVALPLTIAGQAPKEYADKLDSLFQMIGLGNRRDHLPDQLSGGEQQRVAVARALIGDPAIVLADEPTGNLDRGHGREILRLLKRSSTKLKQTILMVTHDPSAAAFADRVVFLRDGLIVKELSLGGDGNVEAIIACLKELED